MFPSQMKDISEFLPENYTYWDALWTLNTLSGIGVFFLFFTPIFGILAWILSRSSPINWITYAFTTSSVATGLLVLVSYVPFLVDSHREEAALENIQQNLEADTINILNTYQHDATYQIDISFNHEDSPYTHQTSMAYNAEFNLMLPVLSADADTLPVKEGSELESVLQEHSSDVALSEDTMHETHNE